MSSISKELEDIVNRAMKKAGHKNLPDDIKRLDRFLSSNSLTENQWRVITKIKDVLEDDCHVGLLNLFFNQWM